MTIPASHAIEAQKLVADAEIDLFRLTPTDGSGTLYFTSDSNITWLGQLYTGIPMQFGGEKLSSDTGTEQPKLVIGQNGADLTAFKPLIYDGGLDGAVIVRLRGLLGDFLAGNNVVDTKVFRVKRLDSYGRSRIEMTLSSNSEALDFTIPQRQYIAPDFQAVYYGQ